jgi:hypothetical protein
MTDDVKAFSQSDNFPLTFVPRRALNLSDSVCFVKSEKDDFDR